MNTKAGVHFMALRNVWKAKAVNSTNKLRIFYCNVTSVLLFGSETLSMSKQLQPQAFIL